MTIKVMVSGNHDGYDGNIIIIIMMVNHYHKKNMAIMMLEGAFLRIQKTVIHDGEW